MPYRYIDIISRYGRSVGTAKISTPDMSVDHTHQWSQAVLRYQVHSAHADRSIVSDSTEYG